MGLNDAVVTRYNLWGFIWLAATRVECFRLIAFSACEYILGNVPGTAQ